MRYIFVLNLLPVQDVIEISVREDMKANAELLLYGIAMSGFGVALFYGACHVMFFIGSLFKRAIRQRGF